MKPTTGYPTYCVIEAPNADIAQGVNAQRLVRVITFDKKPSRDSRGKYQDLVLHVDEDTASIIVAEIQFFAGLLTSQSAKYRYAARMTLVQKDDYIRLAKMNQWTRKNGSPNT